MPELEKLVKNCGQPAFKAKQLWQWIWQKGCQDFELMTNLAASFRKELAAGYHILWPQVTQISTSQDGTIKFLLELHDSQQIETVLIPEKEHYTLCISSQVGCAMGCKFCSTGQLGLMRNMQAWEIAAQILVARKHLQQIKASLRLKNIVIMGMGEPLLNWEQTKQALVILGNPQGLNFSRRRITLSSVGIKKPLLEFAASELALPAISLHAPTQELREQIMPGAARQMHIKELIDLLRSYPLRPRERITIEYILLGGVNDSPDHARQLVRLLSGLKCKVNLISYNPGPNQPFQAPSQEGILAFEKVLWNKDMTAILRKSKGQDIAAACGQLRLQTV